MLSKLTIIPRVDIRMITEIVENGETEFLGEQREFRRHPVMDEFLAQSARLSIAWVRLAAGQALKLHQHPIRSMVLVCRGQAVVFDDGVEKPLVEGDAILIPAMYRHAFGAAGPDGAEGLSIQFEQRGIFEDEHNPLIKY